MSKSSFKRLCLENRKANKSYILHVIRESNETKRRKVGIKNSN